MRFPSKKVSAKFHFWARKTTNYILFAIFLGKQDVTFTSISHPKGQKAIESVKIRRK